MQTIYGISLVVLSVTILAFSIKIISPTHRGVIERLGKYHRFLNPGFHLIIPIVEVLRRRNITERMSNVSPQDIITKDNLNARVDLVVYHKVRDTDKDIFNSYYNVENYKDQIIMLSQTTARNVIGDMKFAEVNSQRNILNKKLAEVIDKETSTWGISIVRVELKEITPPADVQETMNRVIKAQNEKEAAIDYATATETKADGERRAAIKQAEGIKQAKILAAEGDAEAIKMVNQAADEFFVGNAKELKRLQVTETALKDNSKIILSKDGMNPNLLIGNLGLEK